MTTIDAPSRAIHKAVNILSPSDNDDNIIPQVMYDRTLPDDVAVATEARRIAACVLHALKTFGYTVHSRTEFPAGLWLERSREDIMWNTVCLILVGETDENYWDHFRGVFYQCYNGQEPVEAIIVNVPITLATVLFGKV